MDRTRYKTCDDDPTVPVAGMIVESSTGMVRGVASVSAVCVSWVRMSGKGRYNDTTTAAQWARWARGGRVLKDRTEDEPADVVDEQAAAIESTRRMYAEIDAKKAVLKAADAWVDAPSDQTAKALRDAVQARRALLAQDEQRRNAR